MWQLTCPSNNTRSIYLIFFRRWISRFYALDWRCCNKRCRIALLYSAFYNTLGRDPLIRHRCCQRALSTRNLMRSSNGATRSGVLWRADHVRISFVYIGLYSSRYPRVPVVSAVRHQCLIRLVVWRRRAPFKQSTSHSTSKNLNGWKKKKKERQPPP